MKFKNDMKAGTKTYTVCKDMQKKVKQSNITSIFPEYSIFSSPIQPMSFDYPDNFQLAATISFQSTPTQTFHVHYSLIHILQCLVSLVILSPFFKYSFNFAHCDLALHRILKKPPPPGDTGLLYCTTKASLYFP